ncbi:hypothetical protein TrST_g1314 [Triparma strigata]|uniref:L-dopachrome isomerase n=1 Tax=Triparma strigata TaxID=1606541 RepID=A0A9W7BE74_9STRA|nr:hypothetical protein TrST_g1314 [Triparma strigata]
MAPTSSAIALFAAAALLTSASAWVPSTSAFRRSLALASAKDSICDSPGDPSMILNVSVDLGDKKVEVMKGISAAIAATTGKPESYVSVCVQDNASIIFGGEETNCALGCMYSIGAINQENNGKIQKAVSDLLAPFGVPDDKMYINYFDVARENCGWSSRTFAG